MRRSAAMRRVSDVAQRLVRDEGGAVLIYVSIALTVFIGFAALVIDGSRLFALDTELQSAADAIALAGAAELDGNADAQDRANLAMNNLVQNADTFGNDPTAIVGPTEYTPRFLSGLPDDDQPLSDATVAATQADARFVEVRVNERQVDSMFATAIGGEDTVGADAVAVAGFTSAVCKFTPLFMCNPYSSPSEFFEKIGTPEERRRLIALKQSNGGEDDPKYGPGNFGFLGSIDNTTSFKESLAKVDPGTCFKQNGVDTEPGNKVSARTALNTRFDLYDGSFNKHQNKDVPEYRPARNVTKGYTGNADCKKSLDEEDALGFPIDSNLAGDTPMGNGDWDFEAYWDMNHGDRDGVYDATADDNSTSWDNDNLPSRYEVYRWEIDNEEIPDNSDASPVGEDGTPQCSKSDVNDEPDRRVLYAAVIDCAAYGDLVKGKAEDIPVLSFVKMFMTQPLNKKASCKDVKDDEEDEGTLVDCNGTLFVEMMDIVRPGVDDAVIHDIVQLYR
jgi:hypothetical protein